MTILATIILTIAALSIGSRVVNLVVGEEPELCRFWWGSDWNTRGMRE